MATTQGRGPIWLHPKTKRLRRWINRSLDRRLVGVIQYDLGIHRREIAPFNGQTERKKLVEAIFEMLSPAYVIETGTFHGNTTSYLAKFGVPVFSIEQRARRVGYARRRLRGLSNVTVLQGDSRTVLPCLLAQRGEEPGFFYLDAHWLEDNPLREEVAAIHSASSGSVSLIDDLAVPGDAGYAPDRLPTGETLTLDFIADICRRLDLSALLPSTPSAQETGYTSGYAVIAARSLEPQLLATGYLRPHELSGG